MNSSVTFREVVVQDGLMILRWRTQKRVDDFMTSRVTNTEREQTQWIVACREKPHYYHWIFQFRGADAGLISLADFDESRMTASWGMYLGDTKYLGLGALVPPYFYNWLFHTVGLCQLSAIVLPQNATVAKMHRFHGYTLDEPGSQLRDYSITKPREQRFLLLREDWLKMERFKSLRSDFPIDLWNFAPARLRR